ncbi:MAG: hypothetical protein QG577_409 [Thermodesulfobacteriota bacterium]|nr:hypothetical protein [Thermodesulfobacteriota bacterium]
MGIPENFCRDYVVWTAILFRVLGSEWSETLIRATVRYRSAGHTGAVGWGFSSEYSKTAHTAMQRMVDMLLDG